MNKLMRHLLSIELGAFRFILSSKGRSRKMVMGEGGGLCIGFR